MIQRDDNMRVYGNGTTVVITYRGCGEHRTFLARLLLSIFGLRMFGPSRTMGRGYV